MARALRHNSDNAQAFNCALLLEGIDDLLRAIPNVIVAKTFRLFVGIISIGEGDREVRACDQGQDEISDLCFFVRYLFSRVVDNTRRAFLERTINLIKLFIAHIAKLFTQEVVAIRMLHVALIKSKHCAELVGGKIELSHDRYLSIGGRVALADLPFAFPHHLYYAH